MNSINLKTLLLAGVVLVLATACGGGSEGGDPADTDAGGATPTQPAPPVAEQPFKELYEQGVARYLGVFAPAMTQVLPGGVKTYSFDGKSGGPICFTGNPYAMSTRDGSSRNLMIFLQGGGLCGPNGCDAVEAASPVVAPAFGILNPSDQTNPVRDYDVAYLPYCDGSLWMGDRDLDSDGDGNNDRLFRGLQNLSASLDVIVRAYPSPDRILLAGNSAGGFGTHPALPLVRRLYPGVPIELLNDSGMGILPEGGQATLNEYWNSGAFFPASCKTCIGADGNLTDYHKYQLAEDSNLRVGFVSYKQDAVVTAGEGNLAGPEFERQLLEAVAELRQTYPERFQSMIANGDGHTFIIKDFDKSVGGKTVRQWVGDMLNGNGNWVSVSD